MDLSNVVVLDVECYTNYFLIAFKNLNSGKVTTIEIRGADAHLDIEQRKLLNKMMTLRVTFGFNSNNYDMAMILYALGGKTCAMLKKLSDRIIESNSPGWMVMREFDLIKPRAWQHFDIKEPAPGVMISLKLYGGRLHCPKLQDLPYGPDVILTDKQMDEVRDYCGNDLDTTIDLYNAIKGQIKLRAEMSDQHDIDLMSKSDAQIAETVIKARVGTSRKGRIPSTLLYKAPDYIKFQTEQLQELVGTLENIEFKLADNGAIKLPKLPTITMGRSTYKIGIGGLHSTEHRQTVKADAEHLLIDKDVTSYYPSIILNLGLFPKQMGNKFLDVYRNIYKSRLSAKARLNEIDRELARLRNG